MMTKIAFITPWYGPNVPGGAEQATRGLVEHLKQAGLPVEVWTTCIKDFYADWSRNHYKAGVDEVNGITVRRFPVEDRNRTTFNQLNWRLMNGFRIKSDEEHTFIKEMIRAPSLYEHVDQHQEEHLFFFVPYMFSTTYFGCQIAPERSVVITNLHDEAYAHLDIYKEPLTQVRSLIFKTNTEKELAQEILGLEKNQIRKVIGDGLKTQVRADPGRFRRKFDIEEPIVLYAGRRENGKNTPLLIDYWRQYSQQASRNEKLVLIGPGDIALSADDRRTILDLGFLSEEDKRDAYAAANVFCHPSVNESFSIVLMESWLAGTPALVHGQCAVNWDHCRRSNGGLYFTNYKEFEAALDYLLCQPEQASILGRQGHQYVLDNYQWQTIVNQFQELIEELVGHE
jgi:glycosyltransferase involved in cell wall biosynthesis